MSFTYSPDTNPTEITLVRFHTTDTVQAEAIFSDEEISMMITQNGSWQDAVIACLQFIATQIAIEPEFTADWLTERRRNTDWLALIAAKKKELGSTLGQVKATIKPIYRGDSLQTGPPDW